jgi:hypothetical protein
MIWIGINTQQLVVRHYDELWNMHPTEEQGRENFKVKRLKENVWIDFYTNSRKR